MPLPTVRQLVIKNGQISFIYEDVMRPFLAIGTPVVRRASHVEPTPDGLQWTADMSPSGGPILGPVNTRAKALAAEVKWLREHNFGMNK